MAEKQIAPNNNILYGVIAVLVVIIALLGGYMLGSQGAGGGNNAGNNNAGNTPVATGESITVTVYDDKRCTTCGTDEIVAQIRQVPFLAQANFVEKDFADSGVEDFLKENNITNLPAVVFSSNNLGDGGTMTPYLTALSNGEYSLQIGATHDPYVERSEKGFLVLDKQILSGIQAGGYTKGSPNAKVTWIEYSDIECPFCARLHNSGTIPDVFDKYGDDINMVFQHYPLDFHPNAKPGAQILECIADQNGSEAFYSLIDASFAAQNSDKDFLLDEAAKLGADRDAIESCLSDNTYSQKVDNQLETGRDIFGVTGTPGNVLINNETGEYEIISGAFPTSSFTAVIDRLLE